MSSQESEERLHRTRRKTDIGRKNIEQKNAGRKKNLDQDSKGY